MRTPTKQDEAKASAITDVIMKHLDELDVDPKIEFALFLFGVSVGRECFEKGFEAGTVESMLERASEGGEK